MREHAACAHLVGRAPRAQAVAAEIDGGFAGSGEHLHSPLVGKLVIHEHHLGGEQINRAREVQVQTATRKNDWGTHNHE